MLPRISVAVVALVVLQPRPAAEEPGRARPAGATSVETPAATPAPTPTATPVPPGSIRVKVLVTGMDGKVQPAADAVAWIPGLRGPEAPQPRMSSRDKRFEPRVLAVPKGTKVTFPNYDKIFHNVFSLSEAGRFDLGLYRNGASRTTSFDTPGVVRVYCNIHPQMAAYVVVLDGSLYAQTGKDGIALLSGVPAGRQVVKIWEERGGEWSGSVVVPAGATAELTVPFDASRWKDQPHKNKYGRDYPPPDDDANRY
jgi:plastocyanin